MTKRFVFIIIALLPLTIIAQTAEEFCKKGENYYYGKNGVSIDYAEAEKWYRKAAEQGHRTAQYKLGYMYEFGRGVSIDYVEAEKWYRKAAEQGYDVAQNILGCMFEEGLGVEQNYNEAMKWYQKAAKKGNDAAQLNLGRMYENGFGVTNDYKLALEWYQKAAAQGNVYAMRNIGMLYEKGYGVPRDYLAAKKWYQEALKKDSSDYYAQIFLTNVEKKIDDVDEDIPQGSKNENLFAVIIGNEKYENEQDVPFAENDARIFREYCSKTLGINDKHILYFTNAGFNNINMAIHWLKTRMEAYDGDASAIFYYAGHGIPNESTKEAYLLPVDGKKSMLGSAYSLKMLNDELAKMPARSLTVFIDASFSGANRDGQQMATTRGIALKVNETKPQGNVILFTAAQGDQTASSFKDQKHGLFTYYLLRKIKDTKGNLTLGELSDYLRVQVKRTSINLNNRLQSPTTTASSLLTNSWQNIKLNE